MLHGATETLSQLKPTKDWVKISLLGQVTWLEKDRNSKIKEALAFSGSGELIGGLWVPTATVEVTAPTSSLRKQAERQWVTCLRPQCRFVTVSGQEDISSCFPLVWPDYFLRYYLCLDGCVFLSLPKPGSWICPLWVSGPDRSHPRPFSL